VYHNWWYHIFRNLESWRCSCCFSSVWW